MVKPLNKEWALFGRKYRVAGAKGEKVDCHACQKQVSAAVNRLQSHLRVCPARPLHVPAETIPPAPAAAPSPDALGDSAVAALDVLSPTETAADANALPVGSKRPRTATLPTAPSQRLRLTDDATGEAYAKRRFEIDEQRLQLECERAQREQKREAYELAILAAQARTAQLAAEKQAYETRVLLALSRKQLRDQGVDEEEIDRVLPIEPLSMTMAVAEADTAADTGADADADANGHAEAAAVNAAALEAAAAVASEGQVL